MIVSSNSTDAIAATSPDVVIYTLRAIASLPRFSGRLRRDKELALGHIKAAGLREAKALAPDTRSRRTQSEDSLSCAPAVCGGRSCRDGGSLAQAWRLRTLQPHQKGTRITGAQKLLFVAIPRRERRYDFRIARTKRVGLSGGETEGDDPGPGFFVDKSDYWLIAWRTTSLASSA
jgi:hypothetical protein